MKNTKKPFSVRLKKKMRKLLIKTGKLFVSLWEFIRKIYKNPKSAFGFSIILLFVIIGIIGPLIWPYSSTVDTSQAYLPPSAEHPFGTDWMGLDIFKQLIKGTKDVLKVAFYTAFISVFIGTVLGILSGYLGGWIDKVVTLLCNIFLSVPSFPVYLMLAALFTINSPIVMALVISVFSWAGLARAIRVEITSLKERDFIQICRVMNMSNGHIIFKELFPNITSYIVVNFVLILRGAILASVGIMLVGLASYNPTDWGAIMQAARSRGLMNINNVIIMLYPLVAILLFQASALLLSEGLDEVVNPRLRRA